MASQEGELVVVISELGSGGQGQEPRGGRGRYRKLDKGGNEGLRSRANPPPKPPGSSHLGVSGLTCPH